MANSPPLDPDQFDRYVSGIATAEEARAVEATLASSPEVARFVADLRQPPIEGNGEAEVVWSDIQRRIHGPAVHPQRRSAPRPSWARRGLWVTAASVAASVVIAAGVAVWRGQDRSATPTSGQIQEYSTRRAQRATIDLPDGSRVILGPESRVRLSRTFMRGVRELELQGQAYFTVAHTRTAPFTVRTATSVTRVLGTVFTVRAYPSDSVTRIAVAEGKVSVGGATPSVVLLPGDVARVNRQYPPQVTHDAKISDVFGWLEGRLTFDGVPFRDVIPELERAYDVKIMIGDTTLRTRDLRITLTDESAGEMLDLVSQILHARYERRGGTVVFFAR